MRAPAPEPPEPPTYRGPIIDSHAHLLTPEEQAQLTTVHPAGTAHLLELDRKAGVTRSALIVIAPRGDLAATRALNDRVIAAANASAGRLYPIGSVHPADGKDALGELARIAAAGVRVIKLHPNTQQFDVGAPEVAAVVARAGELGMAVLFDGFSPWDANQPGKLLTLAISHPDARIIIAHIGGPRFDDMQTFAWLRIFPWFQRNVWFDLSATSHFLAGSPYQDQLVWVVRQIGVDRILFGSDYPADTPEHAVQDVRRLGFTAAEQRQIFFDNARALLGDRGAAAPNPAP
ncbi:MAG TPA: amidohydrolase family protein [Kofleriaceae bacterium]|nr:amidohydrolase family protein [Kofleriaceae bacterium]